jgi:hypothetical protein
VYTKPRWLSDLANTRQAAARCKASVSNGHRLGTIPLEQFREAVTPNPDEYRGHSREGDRNSRNDRRLDLRGTEGTGERHSRRPYDS